VAGRPENEALYGEMLALYYAEKNDPAARDAALALALGDVARRPTIEAYDALSWVRCRRHELEAALAAAVRHWPLAAATAPAHPWLGVDYDGGCEAWKHRWRVDGAVVRIGAGLHEGELKSPASRARSTQADTTQGATRVATTTAATSATTPPRGSKCTTPPDAIIAGRGMARRAVVSPAHRGARLDRDGGRGENEVLNGDIGSCATWRSGRAAARGEQCSPE